MALFDNVTQWSLLKRRYQDSYFHRDNFSTSSSKMLLWHYDLGILEFEQTHLGGWKIKDRNAGKSFQAFLLFEDGRIRWVGLDHQHHDHRERRCRRCLRHIKQQKFWTSKTLGGVVSTGVVKCSLCTKGQELESLHLWLCWPWIPTELVLALVIPQSGQET